ncbi:MAG: sulfatase-like hydrolase/transferase [Phycisphaerales bacterium]|nr:MAG: sulfatase-like hydrolase/transferase [Phycisphaerales bacterium]
MSNEISRRGFLKRCAGVGAACFLPGRMLGSPTDDRPNIVLIVSDDQGYADISCYDHPKGVSTPSMDRLAKEGVRLTNGYASAYVCAPTRAGLLTGRYQQRFGFYTGGDSRTGMPTSEVTIAELLKGQGYATAVIGKWHVGLEPQYRPLRRGFDEFYGFLGHGAHDYFKLKITDEYTSIYRNDKPINDTGYLTQNLAREAVSFIERHRSQPFFLYLPFNAVHWPLQAPQEDIKRFNTGDENRDVYLAMLTQMDDAIGEVLDALERTGAGKNTLVIFFSDNGGARKNFANNGVLRDYKQTVYEGGIRVPFIVRWPGKLPKGTTCDEPIISLDVLPTICAAAGGKLPADRIYDGKNMLPTLRGRMREPLHDALFWYDGAEQWAVRVGRWKLLSRKGSLELYDLDADISEKHNVATDKPQVAKRLKDLHDDWRSQLGESISKRRTRKKPRSRR